MLTAEDLKKLEDIRQFVADQGMVDAKMDILGADKKAPYVNFTFYLPFPRTPEDTKQSSSDVPQS
jgi:hypothetical protein